MNESTIWRISILCLAVFCLSTCGVCWRGSTEADHAQKFDERVYIEGTIRIFQEAIKNKEYKSAYECLTKATHERYSPEEFWLIMEMSPPVKYNDKELYFRSCLIGCRVTSIFFNDTMDEAHVYVAYDTLRSRFKFHKESGLWKIDFILKVWVWETFGIIIPDPADLKKKPPPEESEEDRKEWENFDKEFEKEFDTP